MLKDYTAIITYRKMVRVGKKGKEEGEMEGEIPIPTKLSWIIIIIINIRAGCVGICMYIYVYFIANIKNSLAKL